MKKISPFSQSSGVVIKHIVLCMMLMLTSVTGFSLTYTWTGAISTDWTVAGNWSLPRTTPAITDVLVFNNGAVNTVTNVPTETIGQLLVNTNTTVNLEAGAANNVITIAGVAASGITVTSGSQLNIDGANELIIFINSGATSVIAGNMTFTNGTHKIDGGQNNVLSFNSPAIFTQGAGCTGFAFNASAIVSGGTLNFAQFNTGSIFLQLAGGNPFGLNGVGGAKVTFNTGSLFKLQQNVTPSFYGRTYANVEIDFPGFNQTMTDALNDGAIFMDNLTITQGSLSIGSTLFGVNIKGNISVAAGQSLSFNNTTFLKLNGTLAQSITNNGTLTFGANEPVTFNNAAGITINSDLTFNNSVTFTNGKITVTNPKVMTFSATASVGGTSNAVLSYVVGKVQKVGNTDFIFPLGHPIIHGSAPIGVSNFSGSPVTTAFTAQYIRASASALGAVTVGLDHVSQADYWLLNSTGTGTPTANVTGYWTTESSFNGSTNYINSLPDLVLAHFNGTSWINYGGVGTASGSVSAGSITWSAVNTFAAGDLFSFGSINFLNPLPITINYINGVKQGSTNLINWQVACVNNLNATMVVERSADNRNFTAINTITASALRCAQPFNYYDNSPLSGINYYRLKTINDNGAVTYSSVIALMNKDAGFDIVNLLPNIVTSTAVLNVTSAKQSQLNIVITDMMGRKVQQSAYELVAGSNQFNLNLAHLAAGTYQISGYTAEGINKTIRFVKQ
jgi:hypothetical protein